jgi:hypothetical protein
MFKIKKPHFPAQRICVFTQLASHSMKQSGRVVMLKTQVHLVPRLRMNGALTLLPHYAFTACTGTNIPLPTQWTGRSESRFTAGARGFSLLHYVQTDCKATKPLIKWTLRFPSSGVRRPGREGDYCPSGAITLDFCVCLNDVHRDNITF